MPSKKRFERGQAVDEFTAEDYWDILTRIEKRKRLTVTPPLIQINDKPMTIDLAKPERFYAILSGSTSPYSFAEKTAAPSGAWTTRVRTGTSNAYEVNGVAGLGGKAAWLRPGSPGDYRFQMVQVGTSTGGGTGSLPGCICSAPPETLAMTVSNGSCNNGLLNSVGIQYGPTPPSLIPLRLGSNCYLSTDMFVDSQTGDSYYYYFGCFGAIMRISRVFPTSVFGSPFLDSVIYYWSVGLTGNRCGSLGSGQSFLLSNGQIYSGGDPSCVVTIEGFY